MSPDLKVEPLAGPLTKNGAGMPATTVTLLLLLLAMYLRTVVDAEADVGDSSAITM